MRIAVIGTGYVGLVTGTCLAESGNTVVCVDKIKEKIDWLNAGQIPIFEPGLAEMVENNVEDQRLSFTTSLPEGIKDADIIFIAVGTPQDKDGRANLSYVYGAAEEVADHLTDRKILVIKSTVPVGTNAEVQRRIAARTTQPFDVASNPEFLKEGAAIDDFNKPDRVVVGVRRPEVGETLRELYAPFLRNERPFLVMTPESAEMTKYAANCMLATKISFINEISNLCERVGADIKQVRQGIGHDQRIGFQFLHPGVGYGGSCFPKDVRALIGVAEDAGINCRLLRIVDEVNEAQKHVLGAKIRQRFEPELKGKTIAIWGAAFKPKTDDIREAPALTLIDELLESGADVRLHDPEALPNVKKVYGDRIAYCDRPYGALEQADALAIVTEWNEFRNPDFKVMKRLLRQPIIFDGRNVFEPAAMARLGFDYYGMGRNVVAP